MKMLLLTLMALVLPACGESSPPLPTTSEALDFAAAEINRICAGNDRERRSRLGRLRDVRAEMHAFGEQTYVLSTDEYLSIRVYGPFYVDVYPSGKVEGSYIDLVTDFCRG